MGTVVRGDRCRLNVLLDFGSYHQISGVTLVSQNNDNETDKKYILGKTSVLLGIVATALGVFISL